MRRLLPLLLLATPAASFGQTAPPPSPNDNTRLTTLFDADQHDRDPGPAIDWRKVWPADRARRAELRTLLAAGAVRTGTDYYHAAYIYQHGEEPKDFLLAHTLAVTAVVKGRSDAGWIAAATLDRYLQKIGQPQVYGTQFLIPSGLPATQEPYDRALIGDGQRRAVGVPALAEQDGQRRGWDTWAKAKPRP